MQFDHHALPSNKKFGLFFGAIFLTAASYSIWLRLWPLGALLFITALLILIVAITRAAWLAPANRGWMILGLALGKLVNPIVLGFLFYILITPFGVIGRLLGRDELRLSARKSVTNWTMRDKDDLPAESLKQQF
jgi:hypothetical protein